MTELEKFLAEVKEREQKATKDWWLPHVRIDDEQLICCVVDGLPDGYIGTIKELADAAFAVHARADIPKLLALVERYRHWTRYEMGIPKIIRVGLDTELSAILKGETKNAVTRG